MSATLLKLSAAWPLITFPLLPALTQAETPVPAWIQRYSVPPSGAASGANALVIDSTNNIIVAGYGARTFGAADFVVIKYSSGGTPLWTNYYNGPGSRDDIIRAAALDADDNVIVTGSSSTTASLSVDSDFATIKYSGAGVPLWTNRYGALGSYVDSPAAVVVDGNKDVIVTGRSKGLVSPRASYYVTIKYSSAGVPLWTNLYHKLSSSSLSYDGATALAVDTNNDIIVTGHSDNSGNITTDCATLKYSASGTPVWTNRYNPGGSFTASGTALAVDSANNVFVTGVASSGSASLYSTIKYSSAGVPLWTNTCPGPADGGSGRTAAALDANGSVILTGYLVRNAGSTEYLTLKCSADGQPLWTNRYTIPFYLFSTDPQYSSVVVDAANNVIVTGFAADSAGTPDYATIKYSSAGLLLWTATYNGPGDGEDDAQQVALDHSGSIVVTGLSAGSRTNTEFATIKYSMPLVITGCGLTNGTLSLQLDNLETGSLVLHASTDLTNWLPIYTNPVPTNPFCYTDPDAGNYPLRFYRAHQSP